MSRASLAKQILEEAAIKSRDLFGETKLWEKGLSSKNERLVKEAADAAEAAKLKNLKENQVPRFAAPELTDAERAENVKRIDNDMAIREYEQGMDAEKASRQSPDFKQPNESTAVLDNKPTVDNKPIADNEPTKLITPKQASVAAVAPAFANPADIVKQGYERAKQVKQTVVDKIVDLTDMGLNTNPYVPQYAKDNYRKTANALVSNVTDPTNYIGGVGAADAAIGAASTAYDAFGNTGKPQTSYVDNNPTSNPTQTFKVKP